MITDSPTKRILALSQWQTFITVFTYKMAAEINWHRYGTKLRHSQPMCRRNECVFLSCGLCWWYDVRNLWTMFRRTTADSTDHIVYSVRTRHFQRSPTIRTEHFHVEGATIHRNRCNACLLAHVICRTVKPFNLAGLNVDEFACKFILAPPSYSVPTLE